MFMENCCFGKEELLAASLKRNGVLGEISYCHGAYQHDCFTWEVERGGFVRLPELSDRGKKNAEQFKSSMDRMTLEEKREFADMLFEVIESTGAKSLTDFSSGTLKKLVTLISNYNGMDKEKRALMVALVIKLFDFKRIS